MAVLLDRLNVSETRLIAAAADEAATRFPWYYEHLAGARDSDRLGVPLLREAALAATYYAAGDHVADDGVTYVTSGTSAGVPKRVWWPASDHARYVDHRARLISRFSAGECVTACADLGTGHAASAALEVFARAGLNGTQIDVTWDVGRHVDMLRRDRPDLLFTMPMILERVVAAGGPGYVPKRIVVVGDLAPREWRCGIAARIGMDPDNVFDVLGSIEVGAIAYSDDRAGAYVFHQHVIPELIAANEGASGDGGLLVITSLERHGFPAVRYVSGDLVDGLRRLDTVDGPRWGYDHHLGREGSEIKHGEMLSLHAVAVALAVAAPGVAWQMRRPGMEVLIGVDDRAYSAAMAEAIRVAIRRAHPDVDQMIRSGLVGDIGVEPISLDKAGAKRNVVGR